MQREALCEEAEQEEEEEGIYGSGCLSREVWDL